ncbi:protein GVQW3-like [Gigantopelta aegis]|uniref:protein GVQW3-like n=1 Tax=Gigantopelta aegis TaxID=1735272 RepID=UPI001B88912D|nr:protein GVQW3-like [Gigantopelta aegis]
MDISHRAVIRYFGLTGLTPKEIHEDMVITLGEDTPLYSMVKKWAAEFKHGRESLEDDPRPGRPVTVTTQKTIAKIHDIIIADRRVTKRYIATELGISQERIHAVIHNEPQMSKVSARWVPKLLGPDLKRTRLNMSRENQVFFGDLRLWMRPGSITSNQRRSSNRSSGNTQALRLPRKPRL